MIFFYIKNNKKYGQIRYVSPGKRLERVTQQNVNPSEMASTVNDGLFWPMTNDNIITC